MRFKVESVIAGEEEMQQSRCGLFIYDEDNNEYHVNINEKGDIRITSHSGTLTINPQSMNQIILKSNK